MKTRIDLNSYRNIQAIINDIRNSRIPKNDMVKAFLVNISNILDEKVTAIDEKLFENTVREIENLKEEERIKIKEKEKNILFRKHNKTLYNFCDEILKKLLTINAIIQNLKIKDMFILSPFCLNAQNDFPKSEHAVQKKSLAFNTHLIDSFFQISSKQFEIDSISTNVEAIRIKNSKNIEKIENRKNLIYLSGLENTLLEAIKSVRDDYLFYQELEEYIRTHNNRDPKLEMKIFESLALN